MVRGRANEEGGLDQHQRHVQPALEQRRQLRPELLLRGCGQRSAQRRSRRRSRWRRRSSATPITIAVGEVYAPAAERVHQQQARTRPAMNCAPARTRRTRPAPRARRGLVVISASIARWARLAGHVRQRHQHQQTAHTSGHHRRALQRPGGTRTSAPVAPPSRRRLEQERPATTRRATGLSPQSPTTPEFREGVDQLVRSEADCRQSAATSDVVGHVAQEGGAGQEQQAGGDQRCRSPTCGR